MAGLVGSVSKPFQGDIVIGPASNKHEIDLEKEILESETLVAEPLPQKKRKVCKVKRNQKGGQLNKKTTRKPTVAKKSKPAKKRKNGK